MHLNLSSVFTTNVHILQYMRHYVSYVIKYMCDICDKKYFKQKTWKIKQVEIESLSSEVALIILIQTMKKNSKRSLFNETYHLRTLFYSKIGPAILKKRCYQKFGKIHKKTPAPESLSNISYFTKKYLSKIQSTLSFIDKVFKTYVSS